MFVAAWIAAWAGQAISEAEWARDVDALLGRPVEADQLVSLAVALGRQRDPRCLDLLTRLGSASSGDPALQRAVIEALGRTPGGQTALRELVATSDGPARALALLALGRLGGEEKSPIFPTTARATSPATANHVPYRFPPVITHLRVADRIAAEPPV